MNKNDLENKLSDIATSVEELGSNLRSNLKALSDRAKDILRDIERIDLDELEVEEDKS